MRVKDEKIEISYEDTKRFFKERSEKYDEEKPYCVTMYQDNNKKLVEERNLAEQQKIMPLLQPDSESRVIDIGCGIGRWADVLTEEIKGYLGADFSPELVEIAKKRNKKANFDFQTVNALELKDYIINNELELFNRVIIAGVLMYLNDEDVDKMLDDLSSICEQSAVIYIREAMDIVDSRLTLKNFYSNELATEYNVIYRSVNEYKDRIEKLLVEKAGFKIVHEGLMFEKDALNNRKETAQYYFILERE